MHLTLKMNIDPKIWDRATDPDGEHRGGAAILVGRAADVAAMEAVENARALRRVEKEEQSGQAEMPV